MALSFTDPDKWYEDYKSASPKRRHEILMETIEQPLSRKSIEELDLGMCLVELRDELASNNLIGETIDFFDKLRAKQPDLYREDFHYYDNFLIEYYLFKDEPEKVADFLSRFMEDPVQGIDQMKVLLDELRFYDYTDLAVELCRKLMSL